MTDPKQPADRAHDVLAAEEFGVPAGDPALHREPPHDVLAAEEFGMPSIDPALHEAKPHDILAAEEYGVPAPDPAIHHGPVALPSDPTGIAEAHDILAAEEFALPAGRHPVATDAPPRGRGVPGGLLVAGALALVVAKVLRRRRS